MVSSLGSLTTFTACLSGQIPGLRHLLFAPSCTLFLLRLSHSCPPTIPPSKDPVAVSARGRGCLPITASAPTSGRRTLLVPTPPRHQQLWCALPPPPPTLLHQPTRIRALCFSLAGRCRSNTALPRGTAWRTRHAVHPSLCWRGHSAPPA